MRFSNHEESKEIFFSRGRRCDVKRREPSLQFNKHYSDIYRQQKFCYLGCLRSCVGKPPKDKAGSDPAALLANVYGICHGQPDCWRR